MNTRTLSARSALSSLLALALLAGSLAPAALAQRRRKPVVVTFGQPNIWSLEQAHYLLARMHQTNLDLKARELADDDLDPNAVNGTRINLLKQLLEAGVTFDQGVGFQNQLITRNAQFNSNRQLELTADQDRQQSDLLRLTRDHAQFVRERALLDADPTATKADKDKKDAEVTASQAEIDAVKAKISFNNDELKTLGAAPSGTPVSPDAVPTPFDKTRLPSSLLDSLTGDKLLDLAKDPKLNASTILDNHVQMQYEIIAKQLTLLRDEVGPGERLVFLELPQSIYTSPGDGDEKMAQTWWHVNGYTKTDPLVRLLLELLEVELKWRKIKEVPALAQFVDQNARAGTACDEYYATAAAHAAAEDAKEKWQKDFADWQRKKWEVQRQVEEAVLSAQPKQTPPPAPKMPEGIEAVAIKDTDSTPIFRETFLEFQCDYESARERLIQQLYREARSDFSRAQQGGARDENQMVEAIRQIIAVTADTKAGNRKDGTPHKTVVDAKGATKESIKLTVPAKQGKSSQEIELARHAQILDIKKKLLKILSQNEPLKILDQASPAADIKDSKDWTDWKDLKDLLEMFEADFESENSAFKRGIEFVRLDQDPAISPPDADGTSVSDLDRRSVRTIDIIPRQSSLNVNDLNDTVKAFGLWGSFKLLFGLGGQTSFQRQREQFDQFIHQELFASGFGKGDGDFGWTFGALPGTKRVSPGIRTTYAVLVVPADAESLVLTARGCYFPRHDKEPLDYADTSDSHWAGISHNCGDEQTYIIPVPGSDDSNFWVTNVDYGAADKGGRVTVSVRGQHFSSQMGVLVNGVPLTQSVGLAQPLLTVAHRGFTPVPCDKKACGDLERIDPHEIVFSFTLPKDADGKDVETTPIITLIAPGKAVDLNGLDVTINGTRHTSLQKSPFMLGSRAGDPKLGISDLKVFRASPHGGDAFALLTGTKFSAGDTIYVNGRPVPDTHGVGTKTLTSDKLYRLTFNLPPSDDVTVTIVASDGATATKTFANPLALKVGTVTVLSYEPPTRATSGVMLVRIEGDGFGAEPVLAVEGARSAKLLDLSSNVAIVRLVDPGPTSVITLTNTLTGAHARAVVARHASKKKEEDEVKKQ